MKDVLAVRSDILKVVREFFYQRDYIEVETPIRIPSPALELNIDAEPSGSHFLRTSPELHMKRLVVDGNDRIFQIGSCFRQGERGSIHLPEFAMLEWYRTGADYIDILNETEMLVKYVVSSVLGCANFNYAGHDIDVGSAWTRLNIRDVFLENLGWDPVADYDADRFDLDIVETIEPALPLDCPVVLLDYPAEAAALARCRMQAGGPVAERWELYIGGIELANAFSELTDSVEQRERFVKCAHDRQSMGKEVYPLDEEFLAALKRGMPECGGVALGMDRLVMLLTNLESLDKCRMIQ